MITLDTDTQLPRDAARQLVGHDGAPAEPPALRRAPRPRRPRATASCSRASASSLPSAQPLALRAAVRRRAGHRPVHARRLRRLPGPVRRGLVHRQGHLRRRRVRARARRTLAREPHPQPRPARRLLRALGPGQRRAAATRTIPSTLRAPTSSRRHRWIRGDWQIARVAAAARAGARRRPRTRIRCRALSQWKIFDNLRRSLVPLALRRCCSCSAGCAAGAAWFCDAGRARRSCSLPPLLAALRELAAQARATCRCGQHARDVARSARRGSSARGCSRWRACRTRRSSASTRSCARAGACSSRGASCWNGAPSSDAQRSARTRPARHRTRRCGSRPALARRGRGVALALRRRRAAGRGAGARCCGCSRPASRGG